MKSFLAGNPLFPTEKCEEGGKEEGRRGGGISGVVKGHIPYTLWGKSCVCVCVCLLCQRVFFFLFVAFFAGSESPESDRTGLHGREEAECRLFLFFCPKRDGKWNARLLKLKKEKAENHYFRALSGNAHTHNRKKTSFFAFPFLFLGNSLNGNNFIYLFLCFGPTQKSHLASSSCSGRLELCCRQFSAQQPLLSPNWKQEEALKIVGKHLFALCSRWKSCLQAFTEASFPKVRILSLSLPRRRRTLKEEEENAFPLLQVFLSPLFFGESNVGMRVRKKARSQLPPPTRLLWCCNKVGKEQEQHEILRPSSSLLH